MASLNLLRFLLLSGPKDFAARIRMNPTGVCDGVAWRSLHLDVYEGAMAYAFVQQTHTFVDMRMSVEGVLFCFAMICRFGSEMQFPRLRPTIYFP